MKLKIRNLLFLLFLLVGCGDTCSEVEFDEDALKCDFDSECDDGLFCNGFEQCFHAHPFADRFGCAPGRACAASLRFSPDGRINCQQREEEEQLVECFDRYSFRPSLFTNSGEAFDDCCVTDCRFDADCIDGNFCNGVEKCEPSSPGADERGCVPGVEGPCEEEGSCNEDIDICVAACEDRDGDGFGAISCGGSDCDDTDARRSPGRAEICDAEGLDEDCDPTTFGPDRDGDGFIDIECCNGENCGTDCDDLRARFSPDASEVCNGLDDNCDGDIDESVRQTFYADTDGDGFGDSSAEQVGCFDTIGSGYSPIIGDCDDTNPQIFPGSIVCDPQPNAPNTYLFCETDGTYSNGECDTLSQACVTQPGGHGVCTRP